MSDPYRKSFTQQTKEKLIPDESKPFSERLKESVTDTFDRLGARTQPNETKSLPQKVADSFKGTHTDNYTNTFGTGHSSTGFKSGHAYSR